MKYVLLLLIAFGTMITFAVTGAQLFYNLNESNELKINVNAESFALVTGEQIGPSIDCTDHQPPPGVIGQTMSYQSFSGNPFGDSTSSTFSFKLPLNRYANFPVVAPADGYLRKNSFEQPLAIYTPSSYTVSLSKCPGDFNVNSTDVGRGRCVVGGQQPGGATTPVLRWATKANPTATDLALKCILDSDETYYLNIIHSTIPPYSQPACVDAPGCGVLFTELLDN